MKTLLLVSACLFFAACSFEGGGIPYDTSPDAGDDADDGDAGTDGGADAAPDADLGTPAATIVCTTTVIDGFPKLVLTFGGDIENGFLDPDAAATPVTLAYGSDQEDPAVLNSCAGTWNVPYSVGCDKPTAAWGAAPQLIVEPEVDKLNPAIIYGDGSVRWGDLKTTDGDSVGFTVSGLDCRVELSSDGSGGYIRTKP